MTFAVVILVACELYLGSALARWAGYPLRWLAIDAVAVTLGASPGVGLGVYCWLVSMSPGFIFSAVPLLVTAGLVPLGSVGALAVVARVQGVGWPPVAALGGALAGLLLGTALSYPIILLTQNWLEPAGLLEVPVVALSSTLAAYWLAFRRRSASELSTSMRRPLQVNIGVLRSGRDRHE